MTIHWNLIIDPANFTHADFTFTAHACSIAFAGISFRMYQSNVNGLANADFGKVMDEPDLRGFT